MTSIDRTMYRRVKRCSTTKELIEAYTPTNFEPEATSFLVLSIIDGREGILSEKKCP